MKKLYSIVVGLLLAVSGYSQIGCPNFGSFNTIIFNGCTPLPYNYSTVNGVVTSTALVTTLSNTTNCGASIENNQFFAFQATAASMSFTINPGTVSGGLQAWIFSTNDCITPTVLACNSNGFTTPTTLSSSSFVVGQIYYIMIDGFAGATGNYSFSNITPAPGSGGQNGSTFPLTYTIDSASCGLQDGLVTIMATGATPPYSYSLNGSPFQTSNVFANLAGGDYAVEVKDNNTCVSKDTITVPSRETRLPGDMIYCASAGPLTITAVGGTQFTWTPQAGILSTSPNGATITVAPTQTTDYIVASNVPPQLCKYSDTIRVTVVGGFTTAVSATKTTICLNESSTLSVATTPSSEGPFTYSWTPVTNVTSPSDSVTIVRPTTATQYNVLVVSKDGCAMKDSITIDVQGFGPKVKVTPSANYVCPGTTIQLTSEIVPIQTGPSQDPGNACPNCNFPFPFPQVGTGTLSSSSSPTPFRSFWHDGRVQYIYLASEMQNAGMNAGVITDIQFYVTTKGSGTTPFTNLTVKMGGTALTQLPASTWVTQNMYVVHTSNYTTTANSWNNIPLSIPFNWDGQSNIIIEVCYDNTTWTGWDYVQYSTAFTGATHYADQDNAIGCSLAWEASTNLRPNMKFVYGELPLGNLSMQWTPAQGLSSDTAQHPFATINNNISYKLNVTDGTCSGDTTIQIMVDTAVAIKAVDDFIVCNNSPALLTAQVLNQAQPVCVANYTVAPTAHNYLTSSAKNNVPFSSASTGHNRNAVINLPFTFKFFCADFDSFVVNENGFVTFSPFSGSGATAVAMPATGTPNNTIAGLWYDLNANANGGGSGTVSTFVTGTYPYRTFVIEWDNVLAQGTGNTVSFQIQLFETTNLAEVHVKTFNFAGNKVIGVENSTGTVGTTPTGRNAANFSLTTDEGWKFIPNIQGAGFVTFQWSPTSTLSSEFGDTVYATPTGKTTYAVAALFSNGCVTHDTVVVDTKVFPYSLSVVGDTLCPGESSTLTFNGAASNIAWQPANVLSAPNATVTTATPTAPTTFVVVASDTAGCRVVDSVHVFVKSNGAVSLGNDTAICYSDSLHLVPSGGGYTSYQWSPGGQTSPTIYVKTTGSYYVVLSDGKCMFNSDTISVQVVEALQLKAYNDTTLCGGQTANLTTEAGYTGYLWNTGAQTNNINVNTAGNYSYSALDTFGCRQYSNVVEVKVTNPPVVTLIASPQRICSGEESLLDAGSLQGITYTWTKPNDNNTYTGNTTTAPVAGTYTVTASDNGCATTASINILTASNPAATLGADVNTCSCDTSIVLNSGSTDALDSFLWSNGEKTGAITVSTSGDYVVVVTSQYGCTSTDTVRVDIRCLKGVASANKYDLIKGQNTTVLADSISYTGDFSYTWTPAAFLLDSTASSTTAQPDSSITYLLRIYDTKNGCEAFDTVRLSVVLPGTYAFPSVFSPNGDGKNDFFAPYLPAGSTAAFSYLRVYNNWSQLVYECENCDFTQPNTGWDGTFKGSQQPNGTYYFVSEVKVPNASDPTKFDKKVVQNPLTLIK